MLSGVGWVWYSSARKRHIQSRKEFKAEVLSVVVCRTALDFRRMLLLLCSWNLSRMLAWQLDKQPPSMDD